MDKVVFPGSFDPITLGHLEIIKRLSDKYSIVYVVISRNDSKRGFLDVEVRKQLIEEIVKNYGNVSVAIDDGLVVDFCDKVESKTIIRGVRNGHDFTSEQTLAYNNAHLDEEIETLLIFGRQEYMHISSSGVRELFKFGRNVSHLVPREIVEHLEQNKRELRDRL